MQTETQTAPNGASKATTAQIHFIPLDKIDESKTNPRRTYVDADLEDLGEDIKRRGLLQPVLVRPKGDRYELVFGSKRLRGCKLAKLPTIEARVRTMTDAEVIETQLVENAKRSDVHPLEEADAYKALHTKHGYSVEDLAAKVAKSKAHVYQRLKLADLVPEARKAYFDGKMTHGAAVALARVAQSSQKEAFKEIGEHSYSDEPISVREVEGVVDRKFRLQLAEASFNRADATLVPGAGACTSCPKRTGNQKELFADVKNTDLCTDPSCFEAKTEADWKKRTALAKESGQRVLSDAETKKVFSKYDTRPAAASGFVDLDEVCWEDNKDRTYRQLLGKAAGDVTVTLARDTYRGGVHELVPRAEVEALLEKKAPKLAKELAAKPAHDSYTDNYKKKQADAKRRAEVQRRAVTQIVERVAAPKFTPSTKIHTALTRAVVRSTYSDSCRAILARRGIESKVGDYVKELLKLVSKLKPNEQTALAYECLASGQISTYSSGYGGESFNELAEAFGVDVKKLDAAVRAESKAKKAAKKKGAKK